MRHAGKGDRDHHDDDAGRDSTFHDHWHGRHPDGIATGMARELGWEKDADPQSSRRFMFPPSLARFAREIQSKLKIRTMRVVGDPRLPVNRVIASWGNVSQMPGIPRLAQPDVDVLVVGETHEWCGRGSLSHQVVRGPRIPGTNAGAR